jgi:uncharacterized protein YqjF (DUF2071 family)
MAQQWHNLLFAHWRVLQEWLHHLVPPELEIDLHAGEAWLAVVPFCMQGVRFRRMPAIPGTSQFPELNVRTYVRFHGKPGVWFFSLDAANWLAVAAARAWFHLPYFQARMTCNEKSDSIEYASERIHRAAEPARFCATYRPIGAVFHPQPGTLEYFLTERYCLFSRDNRGRILSGEIHHPPWSLQLAEARFATNSMASPLGISLGDPELLHFARRQDMAAWPPRLA